MTTIHRLPCSGCGRSRIVHHNVTRTWCEEKACRQLAWQELRPFVFWVTLLAFGPPAAIYLAIWWGPILVEWVAGL